MSKGKYPTWARFLKAEVKDPWWWTCWAVAGDVASEAEYAYYEMDMADVITLYAMKVYHGSFQPKKAKRKK